MSYFNTQVALIFKKTKKKSQASHFADLEISAFIIENTCSVSLI